MLRPGLLLRIAWGIDLVALIAIAYLFSRDGFYGSAAMFIFIWAPLLTLFLRRRALRSSRAGNPGYFGEGRAYIRLSSETRAWVGEPFHAFANIGICAIAVLMPGGMWAERALPEEFKDMAGKAIGASLLAPTVLATVGLTWSRQRLASINAGDDDRRPKG